MGAVPESWMKVKKTSSKSSYVSKNTPSFCQIWLVNKGQLLHTREPTENHDVRPPLIRPESNTLRSRSFHYPEIEGELHQDYRWSSSSTSYIARSTSLMRTNKGQGDNLHYFQSNTSSDSGYSSSAELDSRFEEESLYKQLEEVNMEAEAFKNEAFQELLKRKQLEAQALKAYNKVKLYESARSREFELRKAAEDVLIAAKQEHELLLERKEMMEKELHEAIRNISGGLSCNTTVTLQEFSLFDLETATCGFSESFKIRDDRYSFSVYKGQMSNKTITIKKPHPNNLEAHSEFQKEVQTVGKLQHKNIVSLIGTCPEAYALVYDYMPESLESHLSKNRNFCWKTRTRIISEIGKALLFLHSFRPVKILHGNLKPENILLDSEFSCKLFNFRLSRFVDEDPNRLFSFMDPEFLETRNLTEKSDVYSFGMIILWLLSGSRLAGLAGEVRKAGLGSGLGSVLDSLAGEWPGFVARRLADLGLRCCERSGRDRPVVSPVLVKELEGLLVLEDRPVPSFFLCPILKEIMHDPRLAADGFTYEGEALHEWFKNGRETSPMTNLKLSNLNLTPNHAIRVAIQEWLCNPSSMLL